jgi:outer membrane protein OmpA-like peptidoglycan-associated protein
MPPRPRRPSPQDLAVDLRARFPVSAGRGYASAFLAGCLIGLGGAWHLILSDGGRWQVHRMFTELAYTGKAIAEPYPRAPAAGDPSRVGMTSIANRPQDSFPAAWRENLAASPVGPEPTPGAHAARAPVAGLERLTAAEEGGRTAGLAAAGRPFAAAMEITFDVNSSFLPSGAEGQLRVLLARLPKEAGHEAEVVGAVSDDDLKAADAHEAARYNRWLSERRVERVAGWFERYAGARFTVKRGFVEHDPSRRVSVRLRPRR